VELYPRKTDPRSERRHVYLYDVLLHGETIVSRSYDPEFGLARALLARGITGKVRVIEGNKHRSTVDVEKAAKLRTIEPSAKRSYFAPYRDGQGD
jgi:hypothetical protein